MRDLEEIRKANPVGTASTVHRIIEEAKEKKKPHWALVAAGTALIAGIIGAMVAAWVKIPSAPDAKPIPPADPGKGTQP
jgi:NCAIR mutase (PurE)-related protein